MARKIVVIDDDKVTRKLLTELLNRNGYEAYGAHDGMEGVALVKWEQPELVLTDLLIPLLDGIGVCQQIKSDPELSGIKVIVMSALKNPLLVREARAVGADDFIDKPIRTNTLLELIARLLQN
ncbi:MAG: response regulator [Acidobacteriota bacterium]|jgi:Response regulator containing CheY-like receiver, AAA-type ATPase, and DNA-binding domains|nr:response regulator [Acidobacteriota bacterium]OQB58932.1 MAG: Transcriptional regulatory protein WalR [Candidatus Aminicenantes bacterium ADurb.Bin147]HNQ80767.1 response regulator [Candidatus Aminicenantes bacterium]MDD8010181.1 response regulator [Acidobacteriota bacterium]MDD8029161.1 response regulator [Acidobacteriota bacterium]